MTLIYIYTPNSPAPLNLTVQYHQFIRWATASHSLVSVSGVIVRLSTHFSNSQYLLKYQLSCSTTLIYQHTHCVYTNNVVL